ncbi:probable calcium-binding protein CML46 [Corylus avellana]|uniref:probable calcium-binding protein CML46 n=1 Tax=Corylus avellana TaxID=13451 RepID=UPI00286BD944|nr:probable calcium-binding protein CML46 [Corylus avellana]
MEKTGEDKSASTIAIVGILLALNVINILHMFICLLHHARKIWIESKEARFQRLCNCADENMDDKKRESQKQKLQVCESYLDDNKLSMGEVKMVMEKLGNENYEERLDSHEIARLFEEDQPSPEELKEAFDMFDENSDGFIDAGELGKVLCTLGLMEPLEVECQRMIRVFDDNGDGRIDFKEFVKLVEHSFC